jgi:hypothetical protein
MRAFDMAGTIACLSTCVAAAQPKYRKQATPVLQTAETPAPQTSGDWKQFLTGQPFTSIISSKQTFKMVLSGDGKMTREPLGPTGTKGDGTWALQGDKLCTTWAGARRNCFVIRMKDASRWSIMKGKTEVAVWSRSQVADSAPSQEAAVTSSQDATNAPNSGQASSKNRQQTKVLFSPNYDVLASVCPDCSATPTQKPYFSDTQFQMASTNITGTIFCHNSADEVFVRLVAGSGSLPTFMDDTLLVAALDEIRSASYDECEKAMNAGKLGHDSGMLIKSVPTRFSIGGALLAQSDGLKSGWIIRYNQPRAFRAAAVKTTLMKDFGVLVFVSGSQLSVNPFVYKNAVIGVRVSFDHMVSDSEALFNGVLACTRFG